MTEVALLVSAVVAWGLVIAAGGGAAGPRAVLLATHALGDALAYADDVVILRAGRAVHTGPAAGLDAGRALALLRDAPL